MGTNYYQRTNICGHCDRYDESHIGKSSGGWTFSFHGERQRDPELNPFGVVVSLDDWKARLAEGKIFDEYGKEISLEDFLGLVEMKRTEKNNHTEWCKTSKRDRAYGEKNCWLDEDGNSFSEGEFS